MDEDNKVVLSIVVCVTIMALAGIANNFFTDYFAMKHGLHQQQAIGQSGCIWIK